MKSNTRFNQNKRGIECLNCHQPLNSIDNFCSNCGQVNDLKPLSVKQYISEFFAGFFAFDTRTLNTLIPLLFKPGKITNEYVHGERMKYVNPFQLYLHTSIIFFLITGLFNSISDYREIKEGLLKKDEISIEQEIDSTKSETSLKKNDTLNVVSKKTTSKITIFNKDIIKIINKDIEEIMLDTTFFSKANDNSLHKLRKDVFVFNYINNKIKKIRSTIKSKNKNDSLLKLKVFKNEYIKLFNKKLETINATIKYDKKLIKQNIDDMFNILLNKKSQYKYMVFSNFNLDSISIGKALDTLDFAITRKNIYLFKKAQYFKGLNNSNNGFEDQFRKTFMSHTPIVIFFMLPLFTLFLKLFYFKKKINYTEHLIFVFHVQTTFFLVLLFGLSIDVIFDTDFGSVLAIIPFIIYLFIAFKKVYKQNWLITSLKFLMINVCYFILTIVGVGIVVLLSFIM